MDDLWYSAFNIGTHQTYYSITINVNFLTPGQNNITQNNSIIDGVPYFSSSIRLGSFKNVDFDQNRTVLAKIIGVIKFILNFYKIFKGFLPTSTTC